MAFDDGWREGENAALALRHRFGLGDDAVDLAEVASALGVHVLKREFGSDAADGMYFFDGEYAMIVVNTSRPLYRHRFTLAHELGHHELHRFRGPIQLVDVDVFSTDDGQGGKDPDEVAANAFAAYLMLPRAGILSVIGERRNSKVTTDDVVALVRRFRVSWELACNRLSNENFIRQRPDRQELLDVPRTALMARHGVTEDTFALPGAAVPARLAEDAALLWQRRIITDERLAQILELGVDEALGLMQEWELEQPEPGSADADRAADTLAEHGTSLDELLADDPIEQV